LAWGWWASRPTLPVVTVDGWLTVYNYHIGTTGCLWGVYRELTRLQLSQTNI